jgi:hypothetical protein
MKLKLIVSILAAPFCTAFVSVSHASSGLPGFAVAYAQSQARAKAHSVKLEGFLSVAVMPPSSGKFRTVRLHDGGKQTIYDLEIKGSTDLVQIIANADHTVAKVSARVDSLWVDAISFDDSWTVLLPKKRTAYTIDGEIWGAYFRGLAKSGAFPVGFTAPVRRHFKVTVVNEGPVVGKAAVGEKSINKFWSGDQGWIKPGGFVTVMSQEKGLYLIRYSIDSKEEGLGDVPTGTLFYTRGPNLMGLVHDVDAALVRALSDLEKAQSAK